MGSDGLKYVLIGRTRGDSLIPPETKVLDADSDSDALELRRQEHIRQRDALPELPVWAEAFVIERYELIEVA
jgi:hypothetical protein